MALSALLFWPSPVSALERPRTICDDYERRHITERIDPAVREANEAVTAALRDKLDPLAPTRASVMWLASHAEDVDDAAQWRATVERIDAARERQRPGIRNDVSPVTLPWFVYARDAWGMGAAAMPNDDAPWWESCRETATGAWFTRLGGVRTFPIFAEEWLPGWAIDGELELVLATPDGDLTYVLEISPFVDASSWEEAFRIKRAMGPDSWLRAHVEAVAEIGPHRVPAALVHWKRSPGEWDRKSIQLVAVKEGVLARIPLPFSEELISRFEPFRSFGRLGVLPSLTNYPGIGFSVEKQSLVVAGSCPQRVEGVRGERDVLCMRLAGLSRSDVLQRIAKANRTRRWPVLSTGEGSFEEKVDRLLKAVPQVLFVP